MFPRVKSVAILAALFCGPALPLIPAVRADEAQPAAQPFQVELNCFLPTGSVTCEELTRDLVSSERGLRIVAGSSKPNLESPENPDSTVALKIRMLELDQGFQYIFEFRGRKPLPVFDFVELNVLRETPTNTAHLILLNDLRKCLRPFKESENSGQIVDGRVVLKLYPGDAPIQDAPQANFGWAFLANTSGYLSYGTNTQVMVGGGAEINYSDPDWRFNATAQANYQMTEVQLADGTRERVEVTSFNGRVLILRSIKTHWSVALIVAPRRSPNDNLAFENRAGIALGWDLIPFQGTEDRTVGVRYSVDQVYQNYIEETFDSQTERAFFAHALRAYMRWHFHKPNMDLTASVRAGTKIDDFRYSSLGADVTLLFRLTNNLTLSLGGDVQYRPERITAPKPNPDLTALGQFLRGFNYSPWAVSGNLSLIYQIGETTLYRQDNR